MLLQDFFSWGKKVTRQNIWWLWIRGTSVSPLMRVENILSMSCIQFAGKWIFPISSQMIGILLTFVRVVSTQQNLRHVLVARRGHLNRKICLIYWAIDSWWLSKIGKDGTICQPIVLFLNSNIFILIHKTLFHVAMTFQKMTRNIYFAPKCSRERFGDLWLAKILRNIFLDAPHVSRKFN